MQLGIPQGEPFGVPVDPLIGRRAEQGQYRLQRLLHHPPLVDWVDAHHVRVRWQCAGPVPNMTRPRVK